MRVPRPRRQRAFTLVEILIVVIILGILATIIIGLFQNSAKEAAATSLKDNLRNMRSQLELYIAEHGTYPSLTDFDKQMVLYSDAAGNTSNTRTPIFKYGPYILHMPPLPVGSNKGKTGVTGTSYTPGFGWAYDSINGTFRANLPDADVDGDGVRFNSY